MTLKQAIKHFGNRAAMARALGVRHQAVYSWRKIPIRRQYQIERLTEGKLRASDKGAA